MKYLSFSSCLVIISALILESSYSAVFSAGSMAENLAQTRKSTGLEAVLPDADKFEVAQYVPPKGIGAPPITVGGSTRTGAIRTGATRTPADKCDGETQNSYPFLTGLIPNLDPNDTNDNWGLTIEEKPQFFVYLPPAEARNAEFVVRDEDGNDVYRTKLSIAGKSGIIGLKLPENSASLKTERNYSWYFTVFCNEKNRRRNIVVAGGIRRVELAGNLANELQRAAERDRYQVYAKNGIWYDAVTALAELRQENPDDTALAEQWKKLLESAGLQEIEDSPINSTALETSP
ncbi:MAG TPA: DUF928 domain-containing protein [Leptolyngbyaceae cyanobacterium]